MERRFYTIHCFMKTVVEKTLKRVSNLWKSVQFFFLGKRNSIDQCKGHQECFQKSLHFEWTRLMKKKETLPRITCIDWFKLLDSLLRLERDVNWIYENLLWKFHFNISILIRKFIEIVSRKISPAYIKYHFPFSSISWGYLRIKQGKIFPISQ